MTTGLLKAAEPAADTRSIRTGRPVRTRREAPAGRRTGRQVIPHIVLAAFIVYFALPFWWLIVASTKSQQSLFDGKTSPLWFSGSFDLFSNLSSLFSYSGGLYAHWLGNSFLYAIAGGLGATVLVIPMFVMMSTVHLTNTVWAVILPSMLNPFAVYLMKVYTDEAIPPEMVDAARVDGAGEIRIFARVALPLMRPAVVTVLLLSIVGTWNNFFLPLVMFSNPQLFPVTVGLGALQAQAQVNTGGQSLWNLVITGALISIIPLIVSFLTLQRYWQGGLAIGSVK